MQKSKDAQSDKLAEAVINALQGKKGLEIVKIDFSTIENAICKYFIICHGTSNTHVETLANEVDQFVFEQLNEKVWKKEGFRNAQWVLLDYANVVVHVFQKDFRDFFKLENLWADAIITKYDQDLLHN